MEGRRLSAGSGSGVAIPVGVGVEPFDLIWSWVSSSSPELLRRKVSQRNDPDKIFNSKVVGKFRQGPRRKARGGFERKPPSKRNVSCRSTLTRTDCNAMRCEGIVDPLFRSSAPPFKRNAKAKEEILEVDSLRFLHVVAVQHGSTLRSHCVSIQERRKMRSESGGVKLGSWKKKERIFWWAKGVCGMDLNPFGFFPRKWFLFYSGVFFYSGRSWKKRNVFDSFPFGFRSGILFGNIEPHCKIIKKKVRHW